MLYTLRNDYTSNAYGDNGVYLYLIIQFATSVMLYLLQLVLNIYIVALYFTTVSLCLRIDCRLTNLQMKRCRQIFFHTALQRLKP